MENVSKDISIIEKPERITYDEIYQVIFNAHEDNRKKGILVNTSITSGQGLSEHLGTQAVSYIALDGNNIVGTVSVNIESGKKWCIHEKKIANLMYFGVLPEYAGRKIGSRLYDRVEQYALANDADAVSLTVVERNPARNMYIHKGFEPIDYIYRVRLNQNSVYMVKWLKDCKLPVWLRKVYYTLKRRYIRIKFRGN